MEEKIIKKCKAAGIDPSILTDKERESLIKEIQTEQKGGYILDGVLSSISVQERQVMKDLEKQM